MSENIDSKKLEKDISQLNEIIKLAAELQDKLSRYNARQKGFQALYGMDNIASTIWGHSEKLARQHGRLSDVIHKNNLGGNYGRAC